jgi:hypothetical protein
VAYVETTSEGLTDTVVTATDAATVARDFLAALGAMDMAAAIALFADDVVQEITFPPPGLPSRREGVDQVAPVFQGLPAMADSMRFDVVGTFPLADPEWVLLEYRGHVELKTGGIYANHYFGLFRVVGGRIRVFREVSNPLVAIEAMRLGQH